MNHYQRLLVQRSRHLFKRGPNVRERMKRAEDIVAAVRARPKPKRKPPESGLPVPAVPPKGPLPKHGGAEAPLTFD